MTLFPLEPDPPKPRTRPPEPLWHPLLERFFEGIEPSTPTQRSRMNKLLADYKALGATPDEIGARAARYGKVMPRGCMLTPESLAKHWTACKPLQKPAPVIQQARVGPAVLWRAELAKVRPDLAETIADGELEACWNIHGKAMAKWGNPLPGGNNSLGDKPCLGRIVQGYLDGLRAHKGNR